MGIPKVDLYTGPLQQEYFSRNLNSIEALFNNQIDIDFILAQLAENSKPGDVFTVLDIGSGSGKFLESFSHDGWFPHFYKVLNKKKLRLRVIGLTDSPSDKLQGSKDKKFDANLPEIPPTITIENYFHTLTRSQNLEAFINQRGVTDCKFILASQSLMYLSATVFIDTVNTVLTKLSSEGTFAVCGVSQNEGPLPAFKYVNATEFRSSSDKSLAHYINTLNNIEAGSDELYNLAESEQILKVKSLLNKLMRRIFSGSRFYFQNEQAMDHDSYSETELIQRMSIHIVNNIKKKHYKKEILRKQNFLQNLKDQPDLQFNTYMSTPNSGILSFSIKKLAPANDLHK